MSDSESKQSSFAQLLYSSRTTARCRMRAATRLLNFKRLAFATTTMLSLGLIFIPLWILSFPSNLKFSKGFLDVVQIFLAIATLVYSTIISTANHDIRIQNLREVGGKLRIFNKKLRLEQERSESKKENCSLLTQMEERHKEYDEILRNTEEHSDVDYLDVDFENKPFRDKLCELYFIRKYTNLDIVVFYIPWVMISFEIIVIFDLINVTNLLPKI